MAACLAASGAAEPKSKPKPAPEKSRRELFSEMCRENVLSLRVAPEKGAPDGKDAAKPGARYKRERRAAASALGAGVTASPDPDGGLSIAWDKPAGTQRQCRKRLERLERRFPGRVGPARKPSERFAEAGKRVEGQVPEDLSKEPGKNGALASFFDRMGGRPESDPGVSAGEGLRDGVRAAGADTRPRAELPARYRRGYASPPGPVGTTRTSFGGGIAETFRKGRDWTVDTARDAGDWASEKYRQGRAWTGDRVSDVSKALGMPWSGGLRDGVQLPDSGPGFRFVRYGQWATGRMVGGIEYIGRMLQAAGAPPMEVGDMSYKNGGPIRRHRSHQNGKDVDIFFIGGSGSGFNTAANWTLLRSALDNPHMQVTNVFISNGREAQLLRHGRKIGDPMAARAASVMSYEPGHHDHFHIRIQ